MLETNSIYKELRQHIVSKFAEYHLENPQVYDLFKKFSEELIIAGVKKYSAKAVFERIRWHVAVTTSGDPFKMNNNYSACYARMLINEDSRYLTFFSTRAHQGKVSLQETI